MPKFRTLLTLTLCLATYSQAFAFDGLEQELKIPESCVSKSRISGWDYELAHFSNSQSNRMLAASLSHKPSGIHIVFEGDNNAKTVEEAIKGRIQIEPHAYNLDLLNSQKTLPSYEGNGEYSLVRATFLFENVSVQNGSEYAPTEKQHDFYGASNRKYSVVGAPSLFYPSHVEMVKLLGAMKLKKEVFFGYFIFGQDREIIILRDPISINVTGIGQRIGQDIEDLGAAYDRGLISYGCETKN